MSKIATIEDKSGDVWTGRVESKGNGVGDLAFGLLTGGVGFATLGAHEPTTVVVNGERHSGHKVK
jgi:hypothetical protein